MRLPILDWTRLLLWSPVALLAVAVPTLAHRALSMPGRCHSGPLPALTAAERELRDELDVHVRMLATTIGERHVGRPAALDAAARYVEAELGRGGRPIASQTFRVRGVPCRNLELEIPGAGRAGEIVIVGAHYDSVEGTPGANDNASGVAALLALAKRASHWHPERTLRFVAFVNEEPPYFRSRDMGSVRYAARSRERRESIVAMLSLDSLGYYSDTPDSQRYPAPLGMLYPTIGNFLAFIGNDGSRALVRSAIGTFREHAAFPSLGAVLPGTSEAGLSDQWSFWEQGYPGVMITDTAFFRDPHYHRATDTSAQVDAERLARVVEGLDAVIDQLVVSGPG